MKKLLLTIVSLLFISASVFADNNQEALQTFYNYVKAANTYDNSVTTY